MLLPLVGISAEYMREVDYRTLGRRFKEARKAAAPAS